MASLVIGRMALLLLGPHLLPTALHMLARLGVNAVRLRALVSPLVIGCTALQALGPHQGQTPVRVRAPVIPLVTGRTAHHMVGPHFLPAGLHMLQAVECALRVPSVVRCWGTTAPVVLQPP